MSGSGINTEVLLDYPTSVSAQSSSKINQKNSFPVEKGMNNSKGLKMSHQITNSNVKPDKFSNIYGAKNNKVKRSLTNQKSSSMKIGENRFDSAKSKFLI